ncbi:glycosyltransferase family 4 protein [Nocardia bovistercoris]|uniref:Glycosyltransferase family 4 protein n=1 Tax=Nocardia bovistercoris TaxID=2785916 RepID=A0A931IAK3_9NOCA|nr:glycosyltransferase family 4 protein [Nocardia bovistercoris]MBH0776365.1 glycosyltransferase family 4 protein [Nocardia bovistercoris]
MRIGVIASVAHRSPPYNYGPWEQIASTLAEGFVARGHDVTLFATGDSETSAQLVAAVPSGYEETPGADAKVFEALHNSTAFAHASEFDVFSNHFDFMPLTYSRLVSTPVVTTVHGFSSPEIVPVYRQFGDIAHYIAISDADRHPDLRYADTIHHGIDVTRFTFRPEPGEYLLFLGRIHPDKGTHLAIEVARRAGLPLIIAGVIQDSEYFRTMVEPQTTGTDVDYVGAVDPAQRDILLGGARALLHLIGFAEPFGLSVIESMATGTPVIATPLGSMPEILRHGVTGYLVPDVEAAVEAVAKVGRLDRSACRADVDEHFTADRMTDAYLTVFERIANSQARSTGATTTAPQPRSIGSPGLFSHAGM